MKGLGSISEIHCPHHKGMTREVPRRKHFRGLIRRTGGIGSAIENNWAIEFVDGRFYRVISSKITHELTKSTKAGAK